MPPLRGRSLAILEVPYTLRSCGMAILNCPKPTTKGCVDFLFLLLQEVSLLEVPESLLQLLLRVHHDRTIPCDRFFERLAGD
jgi:hypothetical protein